MIQIFRLLFGSALEVAWRMVPEQNAGVFLWYSRFPAVDLDCGKRPDRKMELSPCLFMRKSLDFIAQWIPRIA